MRSSGRLDGSLAGAGRAKDHSAEGGWYADGWYADMDATRTLSPIASTARLNPAEPDPVMDSRTVSDIMAEIGRRARAAARRLGRATDVEKNAALKAMAARIRARSAGILAANADDVAEGKANSPLTKWLFRPGDGYS